MKIRLVEAQLFHANRRRDMKKLIIAFRNFANSPPKKYGCTNPAQGRRREYIFTVAPYIFYGGTFYFLRWHLIFYGGTLYFWFFGMQTDSCHTSWRLEFCGSSKVPTKSADLLTNTSVHFAIAIGLTVSVYDFKLS